MLCYQYKCVAFTVFVFREGESSFWVEEFSLKFQGVCVFVTVTCLVYFMGVYLCYVSLQKLITCLGHHANWH